MIDDSDGDFALLASNGAGPILGTILLLLAIALYFVSCHNKDECAQKHCPDGGKPRLMDHACLCATEAK
jgi:hypothetical protein